MVLAERAPSVPSPAAIGPDGRMHSNNAEVFVLSHDDVRQAIDDTLARAGCTLQQLREEARSGDWSSETNWDLWFCISPFVE